MNRWHALHLRSILWRRSKRGLQRRTRNTYLLPGFDLSIGINIWGVDPNSSSRVDNSTLGNQKGTRESRTLSIVFNAEICVNVVFSCSRTGERGKNDAV